MQSGVAVSAVEDRWNFVNASPDIPRQMEQLLRPSERPTAVRLSVIEQVLLTNADLDHVLGLLLLRESAAPLKVVATDTVREILLRDLCVGAVLDSFCGVEWVEPAEAEADSLTIRPIALSAINRPRFAAPGSTVQSVGYIFTDRRTGKSAGFFPDVATLDDGLLAILGRCDALFFDGTFWNEDEMLHAGIANRPASSMGHIPINGPTGSLERLAALDLPFCAYFHINNTNPIALPHSAERRAVESRGLQVPDDGLKLSL